MSAGNWPEPRLTGYRSTTWMIFPAKQKEYGANDRSDYRPCRQGAGSDRIDYRRRNQGFVNFTPFRIRVPEDIVVQNTSMYAHLAVMFNRLKFNQSLIYENNSRRNELCCSQ